MRNAGVLYCSWSLDRKEVDGWQTHWYYTASTACSVGQTPPSESLCGATPIGSFDALTCAAGATGTALDPDAPGSAVPIYIYNANPAPGFGIAPIATVYTNPVTHQFSWQLPASFWDNNPHQLFAYAQDLAAGGGSAGGTPIALANTPRTVAGCVAYPSGSATITCGAPAQTIITGTATDAQGSPVSVQVWDTTKGQLMATTSATPGFSVNLPAFADGLAHTVVVYAIDIPTNTPQLIGSQTCTPPPTAAINSIVDPSYCSGGPSMEINWQYSSVGSPMSAFQVRVPGTAFDTGKQPRVGAGAPYTTTGTVRIDSGLLSYDTSYTAELTVWDASDRTSQTVTLAHTTLEGPWVSAAFTYDPQQPAAGIPVTFTATAGSDPDTTPTDARWDFNNDGAWDANGVLVSHTFSAEADSMTVGMEARNDIMPDGVYCPAPDAVFGVQKPIPGYREVRPGDRTSPTPNR